MKAPSFGNPVAPVAALVLLVVAGCAHPAMPIESPTVPTTSTTVPTGLPAAPLNHDIVPSDDLMRACKIDLGNEGTAPKFDFNEAGVRGGDRAVLDQIADCVTVGPLKGHVLHLVGRADSRGESEYNMVLGSARASAVGGYLREIGVSDALIHETSRGKLDATGKDDVGFQRDRRVDIE